LGVSFRLSIIAEAGGKLGREKLPASLDGIDRFQNFEGKEVSQE
jgi:hypothetical protein